MLMIASEVERGPGSSKRASISLAVINVCSSYCILVMAMRSKLMSLQHWAWIILFVGWLCVIGMSIAVAVLDSQHPRGCLWMTFSSSIIRFYVDVRMLKFEYRTDAINGPGTGVEAEEEPTANKPTQDQTNEATQQYSSR